MRTLLPLSCLLWAVLPVAGQTPVMTVVSAASYVLEAGLASGMIVTGFTGAIPDIVVLATETPLPTVLGGYSVSVREAAGSERLAGLIAVARGQISFVIPAATGTGAVTMLLTRGAALVASASVRIGTVSPGLFTANNSGDGAPAGFAVLVARDGSQKMDNLFEQFTGSSRYEPKPFDLGNTAEDVYVSLFGTGLRGAPVSRVRAVMGGLQIPVQASQAHSTFEGLDQVNLGPLPRDLAGRLGQYDLDLTVDGLPANKVTLAPSYPPSGGWGARALMLGSNSELGVGDLNGKIYAVGGYPSNRVTVPTVQVYDTQTNTWSLVAPLPVAVNHSPVVGINGKIYVLGGQTDANTAYVNTVQEFDVATNTWRIRAAMPTARSASAAAVINGKIYVAGGRPPRGADFAAYDPVKDEWTVLPSLPTQRNHLIAAAVNGKMYVIGGRFEGGFQSDQADVVEIYDPRTNQWSRGAALPQPRGGLNGVEAYGCIHTFGGEFATGVHPEHEVYNPVTNQWTSLAPMPVPVHGVTGGAFIGGLVYLPGGGTVQGGSSGTNFHQVYRPKMVCR